MKVGRKIDPRAYRDLLTGEWAVVVMYREGKWRRIDTLKYREAKAKEIAAMMTQIHLGKIWYGVVSWTGNVFPSR